MQRILLALLIAALGLSVGCGGGGDGLTRSSGGTTPVGGNTIVTSGNNVAPLIVDAGPVPGVSPQINLAYTTVTICVPVLNTCQTIDHIAVDTGASGLRIPYGVLNSTLQSQLQNVNGVSAPLAECIQYLDTSFAWGSVRLADVRMGGPSNNSELASSIPVHILGDPALPSGTSIPTSCSNVSNVGGQQVAGREEDTVNALGANGLLGVGFLQFDCDVLGGGNPCASSPTQPPATYYTCSGGNCTNTNLVVPVANQVRNPVSKFPNDNNGVIVELPAVPVGGQTGISPGQGSMVFGIGTQTNNALTSSATILTIDSNVNDPAFGGFTTVFNGVSYPNSLQAMGSFIDSGSNGMYFLDQPTSGIPDCAGALSDFYCPVNPSTQTFSATNKAVNGNSTPVQFNVTNATTLSGAFTAFSDLAGPITPNVASSQPADGFFDWGLPFFYGRNVYVAIQGASSGLQAGPWWAY